MIMEVSLVENMPSVSLCKKLLNHLHFICLARGLDVTRPVIITNALTSINNHIIIEHNNYYLSFLQDMFPYFEKYGLINVLPDIISRIELLMNEKESTINELDKALLLDYKVWLLLSKKDGQNYLTNGGSDFSIRICVKNGNLYRYQYYNNHNWKKNPENKWATSIVKMNGKVIKNMGYLDGTLYRRHTGYYTYLKNPEISFTKNVK